MGRELTRAFDELLDLQAYRHLSITMAVPRGAEELPAYRNIAVRETGRFRGLLWEQIDLPLFAGRRYCVNFTSTAPVLKRHGCVVVHDAQFRSTPASHGRKSLLLYSAITPLVSRTYRRVVTVSDHAKAEIRAHGVTRRNDICVIHNGVDHMLAFGKDDGALRRLGLAPGGFALSNSYIHAHKNVRVLLDAFAELGPDRTLVLFGTTPREAYEARGMRLPDNVVFAGRVSNEELASLMTHARMFLFPSMTEGFGLPPLEAMSLGCPTLSARAGAMPEVCADGALYADPGDAGDWRDKIDRLWTDDSARRALSAAGRSRAARLTWSDAARRYLDLISADAGAAGPG
ncbi:MAG: glycosyltransferase family 1 protein [Xenophilus sp.]